MDFAPRSLRSSREPRGSIPRALALAGLGLVAAGCGLKEVPDWESFYRRQPTSILVVPVENESTEAEAPRFFMATVARPLIDRGYYVLPVEATAEILASEGFTTGAELAQVEPSRFGKYLGADGVLFITIHSWDTTYAIVSSSVTVTLEYLLVDTRSGETVWSGAWTVQRQSGSGGSGNILADLIASAVDAALTAAFTDYVPLAREANTRAFSALPPGLYHPEHLATKTRLLQEWEEYRKAREQEEREAGEAPGDS